MDTDIKATQSLNYVEINHLETPFLKSVLSCLPWSLKARGSSADCNKVEVLVVKGKEEHPSQPRKPSLPSEHSPQKVQACKIFQARGSC